MIEKLILFSIFTGIVAATSQCNLGHKLYSVEAGKVSVLPGLSNLMLLTVGSLYFADSTSMCTQLSVEFKVCLFVSLDVILKLSCANTAHSIAFQGRRTFVSGLILTDNNFLLLCCATLSQLVQQNPRNENRCVWVPPIMTVENGPSIRFDPPLNSNEYIRDMSIKRIGNGQVQVKSQICKFTVQRTNCDEATMPEDDKQAYSLLQLRLSRTESFFKNHNGTDPRDFFDIPLPQQDTFKPEEQAVPTTRKPLVSAPKQRLPQMSTAIQLLNNPQHAQPLIQPQNDAVDARIHSLQYQEQQQFKAPFAQQLPAIQRQLSRVVPQNVAPIRPIVTEGLTANHYLSNQHLLNGQTMQQRRNFDPSPFQQPAFFVRPALPRKASRAASAATTRNLNGVSQLDVGPDAYFSLSGPSQVNAASATSRRPQQRFVLATNQNGQWGSKQRHNLYKPPLHYNSADVSQFEERPFKSSLSIRKLHLGAARHSPDFIDKSDEPTFYGGSFASGEFAASARHLRLTNNLRPFTSRHFPDEFETSKHVDHFEPKEYTKQSSSDLDVSKHLLEKPELPRNFKENEAKTPKAPTLIFQPAQRTIVHAVDPQVLSGPYRTAYTSTTRHPVQQTSWSLNSQTTALSSIPPTIRPVVAPPIIPQERLNQTYVDASVEEERKKQESLTNLLNCCQQQAPGCRHLCTPSVSKEQIKRAIQTNECPPLSMTSVLQCFPRFYNISNVGQCCEQAANIPTPPTNVNSLLSNLSPSPRLPGQCTSLCAPNFKLSFSHFACVDHISIIVDCYQDLIR
ncbi:hypothetical protein M3Y97_00328400 [Aphelenchoides bicaudatus]|nr:hypothetical protein M3Y97_00328400 [Aphelenchoides bicaudatus]